MYSVTTIRQPIKSARGRFRCGFSTSPAVKVTLFHADCENSGPVIARPRTSQNANAPAPRAAGCTDPRSQPFAAGCHQSDVNAAPPAFHPTNRPRTTSANRAAAFVNVNVFWISFPRRSPRVLTSVRMTITAIATSCCVERLNA